ncbi:MAG TPA: RNA-binding S4 domain-containing protein [Acidobacteria bacterium]|nr:RNA-binding S4 domain-containing protein [Acidobacteriota bacterium]
MTPDDVPAGRVRLDVWLDVTCLFKTRSEAQRACRNGKVEINAQRAKPHRTVEVGDRLSVRRPQGRTQQVVILVIAAQHLPKADARMLYEDVTPPPTPEEVEFRRMGGGSSRGTSAPDKRQRRELQRLKRLQGA